MKQLITLFLIVFGFLNLFSQGSEDFTNLPTTSSASYLARTWTGTNGVTWTAEGARTDQTMTGKAICFGNSGNRWVTSPSYANGMGILTFDYVRAFTGTSARTLQVWVNGVQIGTNITVSPTSDVVVNYSANINVSGNVILEIRSTGAAQVNLDNISWTAFTVASQTVTFNGNTSTGGSMSTQTAGVPTALTSNAFTKTGCTFSGWNTAADGSGTAYANGATYSFASDVTLYAQWSCAATYTVTFNGNGSTGGSMSNQTANSTTALTSNAFTKTGCTFSGWNTAADGSGTAYANGANYGFAADVTLYAQWSCGGCSSIFSDNFSGTLSQWSNTGDWTISSGEMKHNLSGVDGSSYVYHDLGSQTLNSSNYEWSFCMRNGNWDPSSSNYFGYYLISGSLNFVSATATLDGYAVGVNLTGTSDLLTLYRVDNGVYTAIITSAYDWNNNGDVCIRVTRTNAGTWEMFYDSGSGESSAGAISDVVYTSGQYTGGLFVYSSTRAGQLWFDDVNVCTTSPINRTVTFNSNTGSGSMSPQTSNVPTALTINTFTKTGCSFVEWNEAADGSGAAYSDGATYAFSSDVTLYAQWDCSVPCGHTVTDFFPTSGPVGTEVTILGTGFTGSTTVEFDGQSATIVSQTGTVLVVEVPSGASTGSLVVTESACDNTAGTFTLIGQSGTCSTSGSDYEILIWNNGVENWDSNYYVDLTGTIPNNTAWVIGCGSGTSSGVGNTNSIPYGFNANERIVLYKDGVALDRFGTTGTANWMTEGRNYRRNAGVTGPSATYNAGEWTIVTYTTTSLGTHSFTSATVGDLVISETADPSSGNDHYIEIYNKTGADINLDGGGGAGTPTVTTQPSDVSACSATFSVAATAGSGGPLTYQWYFNDSVSDNWLTVTVGNLPAGLTITGATTNSLTISSNTTSTSAIDGYQFYCQVTESGTCNKASVAAQFRHDPERFYRSVGSGNWNVLSTWQMATSSGGPWSAACDIPTAANSDYISIEAGHNVTVPESSALGGDQIIIQVGGILTLEEGFNLSNGSAGADLIVNGRLNDWGSSSEGITFSGGATWQLGVNGDIYKNWNSSVINLKDNYEGGISSIPATGDWYYLYDGTNTIVLVNAIDMYYPNLYFESSSGHHSWSSTTEVLRGNSGYATVKGNLYIGYTNTGTVTVYNNNGNAQPMLVQGDVYIGAGSTFSNFNTGVSSAFTGTGLEVLGDMVIEGTYAFDNSSTGTTVLSGSSAQVISSASGGTFNTRNFELENPSGASLDGINVNVSNSLIFTNGILSTDISTNNLVNLTNSSPTAIVNASAQSSNNRYINGKLQWATTSGNTYRFPIGSTPVTYGAQGFDITIDAGSGSILGYLELNNTPPLQAYAYCDFEDHPGVGTVNIGSGNAGYDGILDQATFNLQSDLQWSVTNTSGIISQYDITVLATNNQDINPFPHPDNLAVSANGVAVRYLMKNGEPGNPGVSIISTPDFAGLGFDLCPNQYSLSNLTSFSKFTLNGASTNSSVLPAELIKFDAVAQDKWVDVRWSTASEINVDYFDVERSQDGYEFHTLTRQPAAGNSSVEQHYSAIDNRPLSGLSYYRLNTVDFDGSAKLSDIRPVYYSGSSANAYVVHEENQWAVVYSGSSLAPLTLEVYDASGKLVKYYQSAPSDGAFYLPNQNLEKGVYLIRLLDGNNVISLKAIR
jgi:hypothetical protein